MIGGVGFSGVEIGRGWDRRVGGRAGARLFDALGKL